jgi:hypothetical protein
MLPVSAPLWKLVSPLQSIQFPTRLGGILTVSVAGLAGLRFDRLLREGLTSGLAQKITFAFALLCVVGSGAFAWRIDWLLAKADPIAYEPNRDIDPMYYSYVGAPQLPGFAKTLEAVANLTGDPTTSGENALRYELTRGQGNISVSRTSPRELRIHADCEGEARLRIGQLYSPLWKIRTIRGAAPAPVVGTSENGLIELPLAPGPQELQLVFDLGAPERWGNIVTITSLLFALAAYTRCLVHDRSKQQLRHRKSL